MTTNRKERKERKAFKKADFLEIELTAGKSSFILRLDWLMFFLLMLLCALCVLCGCQSPISPAVPVSSLPAASPSASVLPPMPPTNLAPLPAKADSLSKGGQGFVTALTQSQPQIILPPPQPFTLSAYFPPPVESLLYWDTNNGWRTSSMVITDAVAYIDATTNLTPPVHWVRQSLPYPTNGGTLRVPWTNVPVFQRSGYSLP